MKLRYLAALLIVVIIAATLDTLPDPPAIKSHAGDNQIVLAISNCFHSAIQCIQLDSAMRGPQGRVSWFPFHMDFGPAISFYPLILAYHLGDSSPPACSTPELISI